MATTSSDGPVILALPVTPDNDTIFTSITRGLYVGTTGNVNVEFGVPQPNNSGLDGIYNYSNTNWYANTIFVNVAAGSVLPVRVRRVYSTSTTAQNILALY